MHFYIGLLAVLHFSVLVHANCSENLDPQQLELRSSGGAAPEAAHPGREAVRSASPEVKAALLRYWLPTFESFNISWAIEALDIFNELGPEVADVEQLAKVALEKYFARTPYKMSALVAIAGPPEEKALPVERNSDSKFAQKYDLENYVRLSKRIFGEVLPEVYSTLEMFSGDWSSGFDWIGLQPAFRIAHELHLEKEQQTLFHMMLVHQQFTYAGNAAEMLGNDDLIYRAGLFALATFYWAPTHPYYSNQLWDAIEILKRLKSPEMRERFAQLLLDLTDEITSDSFRAQVVRALGQNEADRRFPIYYSNLIRGLRSSGHIVFLRAEDSEKVDVITTISNPSIREAIFKLLVIADRPSDLAALHAAGARDRLAEMGNELFSSAEHDRAAEYFAAADDMPLAAKAASQYLRSTTAMPEIDYHLRQAFEAAAMNRHDIELRDALLKEVPGQAQIIRESFAKAKQERFQPEDRFRRVNRLDSGYANFLRYNVPRLSTSSADATSSAVVKNQDDFQLGHAYLKKAFEDYYRRTHAVLGK